MRIGRVERTSTAISASNPETILVRGHDLTEALIGQISFTDHVWLLICGALPSAAQRRILDAVLVAIAEHGLVPSVVAARLTYAASPEALQGAVAAGLLGAGSVILGSSHEAGRLLAQIVERGGDVGLDAAAREAGLACRAAGQPIPGYGHPLHKLGDPRAKRLFEIAREIGSFGRHCEAAHVLEGLMGEITKRDLVMNISVAIPAVLLDAGYPLQAIRGAPLLARAASLIAHLLEEQSVPIGFHMAHAAAAAVTYDGPAPEGFVPDEN